MILHCYADIEDCKHLRLASLIDLYFLVKQPQSYVFQLPLSKEPVVRGMGKWQPPAVAPLGLSGPHSPSSWGHILPRLLPANDWMVEQGFPGLMWGFPSGQPLLWSSPSDLLRLSLSCTEVRASSCPIVLHPISFLKCQTCITVGMLSSPSPASLFSTDISLANHSYIWFHLGICSQENAKWLTKKS